MQRLGIAFGAHANAYTSFDETVYMLDLPDLSAETLKLGFTVMRDFGDGALLAAEEIDKERGVILSEKVSRDSVGNRIMEQQFAKLLPDSLVTQRFPDRHRGGHQVRSPRALHGSLHPLLHARAHDLHRRRRHRPEGNAEPHREALSPR